MDWLSSINSGIGGAAGGAAVGSQIGTIGGPLGAAIGGGLGLLSGLFNSAGTPQWDAGAYNNMINQYDYNMTAMYDKQAELLKQRKKNSFANLQRANSAMIPGLASFRGGVAASGVTGQNSSVIANQQRKAMMGEALDKSTQGFAALDDSYLDAEMGLFSNRMGMENSVQGMRLKNIEMGYNASMGAFGQNASFSNQWMSMGAGLLGRYFAPGNRYGSITSGGEQDMGIDSSGRIR